MVNRPRLPDPVQESLEDYMDDHDINAAGEAVRHLLIKQGYDV